jgi:anti-sigma factor RsiW
MEARWAVSCDRERQLISLAVDGQLSEFERVLLAAHLGRCARCRAFQAELRAVTSVLREAPPVPLETPVSIASRPRFGTARMRRLPALSAAAAIAAAFLGVVSLPERAPVDRQYERALVAAPLASSSSATDLLIELRRTNLAEGKQAVLPEVPGGIGAVKPPLPASPG